MPYLKPEKRFNLVLPKNALEVAGTLNFAITQLINIYIKQHGLSYATCNDITGAIENSKLEFYRRVVAPYEDIKATENGDVY